MQEAAPRFLRSKQIPSVASVVNFSNARDCCGDDCARNRRNKSRESKQRATRSKLSSGNLRAREKHALLFTLLFTLANFF
jgi:hypothetical protein